ncbi:response regulator [Methylocaldum sp.]|uniref:response regulator n=1 Tax=Methylocaldum sp. TaxID=1969727 RepID=UPI002D459B39|nr:response regulator [Methylocaldum sp.]HYE34218.1 response regulator [Methylocaldum sp.]
MFRHKNFLVIDDHEINRILLKTQLSQLSAQVAEAEDGTKAVEHIRTQHFDMIFLDLRMPGMTGFDVMQAIRHDVLVVNRDTPVIAVTAHALPQQRTEILKAGFRDCLIKPILEDQLLSVIETWLGVSADRPRRPTLPALDSVDFYLKALVEKTGGNWALARMLMVKLVQELPEQLADVEKALDSDDYHQAREITHRINGSASFCGLVGIRNAAGELESALIKSSSNDILCHCFRVMGYEIRAFLSKKTDLVAALDN